LTRPLCHEHSWAWLIDHTIQTGDTRILAIVGVKLEEAPFGERPLRLDDLHLVALVPMDRCDQYTVAEQLHEAGARTGVPRQIVADGGTDLQKGIERFQRIHPEVTSVLDCAHLAANLLKCDREKEPHWQEFLKKMSETTKAIRQTKSAHLCAPKLRNKARYMNVATFVRFGRLLLCKLQEHEPAEELVKHYDWVSEYSKEIEQWSHQQDLIRVMLKQVREEGHFKGARVELERKWAELRPGDDPTSKRLRERFREYLENASVDLKQGERLVGSTEILESAFGVQKRLARGQSGSGLTVLSVGMGAMLGKQSVQEVLQDTDRVTEKAVKNWASRNFGKTVQWLRRQFVRSKATNTITEPDMG